VVKRADIVTAARSFVGVPYRHQGRTKNGLDCVGLLIVIAHGLGISDFDVSGYARNPSGNMMRRVLRHHTIQIDLSEINHGDILHMAFGKQPQHIAIVSNDFPIRIIHADAVVGSVVEHGLDAEWRSKVRGAYMVQI